MIWPLSASVPAVTEPPTLMLPRVTAETSPELEPAPPTMEPPIVHVGHVIARNNLAVVQRAANGYVGKSSRLYLSTVDVAADR